MGVLRSLGEGGHASAGSAEDTKGTTAVKPWGSTMVSLVLRLLHRGDLRPRKSNSGECSVFPPCICPIPWPNRPFAIG